MQTDKDNFQNGSIVFNEGKSFIGDNPLIYISKIVVYLRTISRQWKDVAPGFERTCCENPLDSKGVLATYQDLLCGGHRVACLWC